MDCGALEEAFGEAFVAGFLGADGVGLAGVAPPEMVALREPSWNSISILSPDASAAAAGAREPRLRTKAKPRLRTFL